MYNGHGDVVQTVSRAGEIENQYDYDIFGNPTLVIEEGYSSEVRYAGEFYDAESGLYYLRARYYNPYTARFISEDSYWGEDENPLSLNRYTYVLNSPLMYWDPTGHWEQGDEKLNPEAQAKLIALTSAYYSAQTELEQDSIRGMAQAIRKDSHSKDTVVTPLQLYTKEIEAVNSEADASRGYMNAEEWFAALKTEGIGTSSTSIRVDEDNYSTSTTTTFGITNIGVQSSASYWTDSETDNMTGKSEAAMSIKYKLEPNDAKFVYSSAREDVSLEQTLVVLELMKRNGGKLTKEQYESAGITVEPDRWDSKTGTHSFYETNYQVSLHGYTIGDLNDQYIQENLRLEEIFGVFALRVSNEKDLTLTTKKADKVKVEERQAGITKEKEATGETSSGYRYKLNLQQFGGKGTGGGGWLSSKTGEVNWKSKPNFGHTFDTHGAGKKNLESLKGRSRTVNEVGEMTEQGQWLDNQKAAEFLNSYGKVDKPTIVDIPEGLGQVIKPSWEIAPVTKAVIIPNSKTGTLKTAYPVSDTFKLKE